MSALEENRRTQVNYQRIIGTAAEPWRALKFLLLWYPIVFNPPAFKALGVQSMQELSRTACSALVGILS